MNFSSILKRTAAQLQTISTTPLLDAELLLAHVLGTKREFFYVHGEEEFAPSAQFDDLVMRRLQGEPIAYLLGKKEFWSLELTVTPDVLIPRPETELLVELALQKLDASKTLKILDLGTGSGAIALALKHERPHWEIYATDHSHTALEIAKKNATHLNLHINFIVSDWWNAIHEKFDAIISNPPYIALLDPHLAQLKYEPQTALTAGADGLDALRIIINHAPKYLYHDGWLMVEHGFDQGDQVRNLMHRQKLREVITHHDLSNQPRVTIGKILRIRN